MSYSQPQTLHVDAPYSSPPTVPLEHGSTSPRKRKRLTPSGPNLLFNSFSISDTLQPIVLHPHFVIPRNSLPLSLLDLLPQENAPIPSRLFKSSNHSLHQWLKGRNTSNPSLLVASTNEDSRLGIIESVHEDVFVLCQLVPWLSLEALRRQTQLHKCHLNDQPAQALDSNQRIWWQTISYEKVDVPLNDGLPLPVASDAPEQISTTTAVKPERPQTGALPSPITGADLFVDQMTDPQAHPQTFERVCKDIVLQYLEVLYLSKASVAYFAKSTLSRARAFIEAGQDGSLDQTSLASAIREMVYTNSTFEKRYESKLQESLTSRLQADADVDLGETPAYKKAGVRSKPLKKPKPGKDGLYTVEPDYLVRWWQADGCTSASLTDGSLRRDFLKLRYREGLLQAILLLEAIALEGDEIQSVAACVDSQQSESQGPTMQPQASSRSRKPKNLHLALESLIDRVCIWDSIDSSAESPSKSQIATNQDESSNGQSGGSDRLKHFCVDVLVPFYAPRLPKKVEEIAARMGVSIASSTHKRNDRPSKRHKGPAPGSEVSRHALQSKRRELARVSSDTNRFAGPAAPRLSRSSTDTLLFKDIKRERSSTPQEGLRSNPRRTLSRTSSINSGKVLQQRTVDLSALNQFRANRDKQKSTVDQELKSAISVLKKPNRAATAREFADAAAQRAPARSKAAGRSRLAVEIGVTPRRDDRTTDLTFDKPAPFNAPQPRRASPDAVPSSSHAFVLSSTAKNQVSSVRRSNFSNIFETPSRGPSKMVDALQRHADLDETLEDASDTVPQSVVKPSLQTSPSLAKSMSVVAQPDFAKPAKPVPRASGFAGTPVHQSASAASQVAPKDTPMAAPPSAASTSIYDVLGWDDDEEADDLL